MMDRPHFGSSNGGSAPGELQKPAAAAEVDGAGPSIRPLPPRPGPEAGWSALQALLRERSMLAALRALHRDLGDIFQISVGSFQPIVLAGPEASHFVLVEARDRLSWRPVGDPVTALLRRGLLVTDGQEHDHYRRRLQPPLHKRRLPEYVSSMVHWADYLSDGWDLDRPLPAVIEMRKLALLILADTLFDYDLSAGLNDLLPAVERVLKYISPGLWLLAPRLPRIGYRRAIEEIDRFLYRLIDVRQAESTDGADMLSLLVTDPALSRDQVRDQLLTILIAGHDTSTAQMAWTLALLAQHPPVLRRVVAEVDEVLAGRPPAPEDLDRLRYLDQVLAESLRMYPPIHLGNRIATEDLSFRGYRIPAGSRVIYSIYLTHRDPTHWPQPDRFDPGRFAPGSAPDRPGYAYIPFGGGPRNCVGLAFSRVEAKVVICRLLQRFEVGQLVRPVRQHMGATLEPAPEVYLQLRPRDDR